MENFNFLTSGLKGILISSVYLSGLEMGVNVSLPILVTSLKSGDVTNI